MSAGARHALVTGASRGIGRAIAARLLAANWRVIGSARHWQCAETAPAELIRVELGLADLDALPAALQGLQKAHPEIDTLVLNAGIGRFGALEQFSPRQVRELVDVNLTAQILLARAFLPLLKRRGGGDLVFIGSEAGLRAGRNGAVYSAAKFGLRGLAQALREECAPRGVRVGLVNPGMVRTGFFDHLDFRPGPAPDQHLIAEDVAEAVWLMLSARTGAVIDEINLAPQKKVIEFGPRGDA